MKDICEKDTYAFLSSCIEWHQEPRPESLKGTERTGRRVQGQPASPCTVSHDLPEADRSLWAVGDPLDMRVAGKVSKGID